MTNFTAAEPFCVACGNARISPTLTLNWTTFYDCSVCGSWTAHPRPTEAEQVSLHMTDEYSRHPYFSARRDERKHEQRFLAILKHIERANGEPIDWNGKRVLDIGCDTGGLMRAAQNNGMVATGFEINQAAADIAREAGLQIVDGTIENSRLSKGSFDLVTAIDVIEHVTDPLKFTQAISRHLKPNGFAYIETPNIRSIVYALGMALQRMHLPGTASLVDRLFPRHHLQYFHGCGLKRLMSRDQQLICCNMGTRRLASSDIGASPLTKLALHGLQLLDRTGSKVLESRQIIWWQVARRV